MINHRYVTNCTINPTTRFVAPDRTLRSFHTKNERAFLSIIPASSSSRRSSDELPVTTSQFQGDFKNRFFYSFGGAVEATTYTARRARHGSGSRGFRFRRAAVRFVEPGCVLTLRTGVQEPSLSAEFTSLYKQGPPMQAPYCSKLLLTT